MRGYRRGVDDCRHCECPLEVHNEGGCKRAWCQCEEPRSIATQANASVLGQWIRFSILFNDLIWLIGRDFNKATDRLDRWLLRRRA